MKLARLTWDTLDWAALDRLRDSFLAGKPAGASYWTSRMDLENYDFTFAQRIGWKWDAVLRELKLRGWTPPRGSMLDWACGSGIAGRRVVEFFGPEHFSSLSVFDHSPLAMEFAVRRAQEKFPSLRVEPFQVTPSRHRDDPECGHPVRRDASLPEPAGSEPGAPSVGTLIISHVANELTDAGVLALHEATDQAGAVLWVEPGTNADSRVLIKARERLGAKFLLIAPCTHQAGCGLCAQENARHWCHHFASPPAGIMADSNWVRFARRAGIDLRSLPYSFLVLERKGLREPVPGLLSDGYSRIIGAPRFYKGYAKIFSCQADGVRDLTLQKRDAPELFKALKGRNETRLYRWQASKGRIEGSEGIPVVE